MLYQNKTCLDHRALTEDCALVELSAYSGRMARGNFRTCDDWPCVARTIRAAFLRWALFIVLVILFLGLFSGFAQPDSNSTAGEDLPMG